MNTFCKAQFSRAGLGGRGVWDLTEETVAETSAPTEWALHLSTIWVLGRTADP